MQKYDCLHNNKRPPKTNTNFHVPGNGWLSGILELHIANQTMLNGETLVTWAAVGGVVQRPFDRVIIVDDSYVDIYVYFYRQTTT